MAEMQETREELVDTGIADLKTVVVPSWQRALVFGVLSLLVTLPVTLSVFAPSYFIEALVIVFSLVVTGMRASSITLLDNGEELVITTRIGLFPAGMRKASRNEVSCGSRVLSGPGEGGYYDPVVIETIYGQNGRPLFSRLEHLLFGHSRIATGIRKLFVV